MPILAMNQSAANALLNQYGKVIDYAVSKGDFTIDAIIDLLEDELKKATEVALNVYHALGYTGNDLENIEKQFNERINDLQKITFNLNGPALQKEFLNALDNSEKYKFDQEREFKKFIEECKIVAKENTVQVLNGNIEDFETVAVQTLMSYIVSSSKQNEKSKNKNLKVKGISEGMLYNTKGYKIGKFGDSLYKCGQKIRNAFYAYLNSNKKKHKFTFIDSNTNTKKWVTIKDTVNDNSLEMEFEFSGIETLSFLKMNEQEREALFGQYPELQEQIVLVFKEVILEKCQVGKYESFLEEAIDRVVGLKGGSLNALFGATATNLTGVLGEIQALFYILVITNENKGKSNTEWVGGIKNPHADLLVKNTFENYGIQVKNTASFLGAQKEIEFRSFGVTGWKEKEKRMTYLEKRGGFFRFQNSDEALNSFTEMGLPPDLSEAIQTILLMKTFNVEYNWVDNEPKEGFNEVFDPTRKEIEHYSSLCQKAIVAFITSLMYMQLNNLSNQDSNIIYIVAGTTAVSAATILSKIIDEMKNGLRSFQMSMKTSSATSLEGQTTIVDIIRDRSMSKDDKNYNRRKHIGGLHFAFQSSYTFV